MNNHKLNIPYLPLRLAGKIWSVYLGSPYLPCLVPSISLLIYHEFTNILNFLFLMSSFISMSVVLINVLLDIACTKLYINEILLYSVIHVLFYPSTFWLQGSLMLILAKDHSLLLLANIPFTTIIWSILFLIDLPHC